MQEENKPVYSNIRFFFVPIKGSVSVRELGPPGHTGFVKAILI